MTVLALDELKALVASGLEDADLQVLLEREEDRLRARLGMALTGEVTFTFHPADRGAEIRLPRRCDPSTVTVTDDLGAVDVATDGTYIARRPSLLTGRHPRWLHLSPIVVEATLDDLAEVKSVIIELIQNTLTAAPYIQEGTEGHSYTRSAAVERQRRVLIQTLDPHRGKPVAVSA